MPRQDEIQQHFTQAEKDTYSDLVGQLEALLQPKLINLSEEENVKYGVIDEQNKLFVNKVNDFNTTQPALSSPAVNWTEFDADYADRFFLENAAIRIERITKAMGETKRMHDHDNFKNGLLDYEYAKYQDRAEPGVGYDVKVRELGQFFKKGGSTEAPPIT